METEHRREREALEQAARGWPEAPASRPAFYRERHAALLPTFEDGLSDTLVESELA